MLPDCNSGEIDWGKFYIMVRPLANACRLIVQAMLLTEQVTLKTTSDHMSTTAYQCLKTRHLSVRYIVMGVCLWQKGFTMEPTAIICLQVKPLALKDSQSKKVGGWVAKTFGRQPVDLTGCGDSISQKRQDILGTNKQSAGLAERAECTRRGK